MSYVFAAYAVDLSNLQSVIGTQDETLVQKVVRSNPEEFDEEIQEYKPDEITHLEVLRSLLAGTAGESDEYSRHGYAFKELARYLSVKDWSGYILDTQKDIIAPFLHRSPVALPPDDYFFPVLGFMTNKELEEHFAAIESAWINEENGAIGNDAKNILAVMKVALRKGIDVVLAYG